MADITCIRLLLEFVYTAVILDAFSRHEIGWALVWRLEDTLTLGALRMAIGRRRPTPGLVHHSDCGVQYASRDYTNLLREHGIQISMSRRGNPYDNARCESFLKTLKYEEVYRQEYRDLAEARASIEHFLEEVRAFSPAVSGRASTSEANRFGSSRGRAEFFEAGGSPDEFYAGAA